MFEGSDGKHAYWQWHLRQWEVVGGTLKEYAQSQGLSVKSLYAARSAARSEQRAVSADTSLASAQPLPRFVPLTLSTRRRDEVVRVECPNGFRVEVPVEVSEHDWLQLRELFAVAR